MQINICYVYNFDILMIIKLSHKLGQNADTALSYLRSLSRNNEYKLYVNKIPVSEPPTLLNTQLSHNLRF